MIITFNGMNAFIVANATNRSAEVLQPDGTWRTEVLHKVRALATSDPNSVRLRSAAHLLAEDVMRRTVDPLVPPLVLRDQLISFASFVSNSLSASAANMIAEKLL